MEIRLFPVPDDWEVLDEILAGKHPGYLLQHMGLLFSNLLDGEPGEEWLEDLDDSSESIEAMYSWFEQIKSNPHWLGIHFYGASRGHDHWSYILELAADNEREKELGKSAIFGSTPVHEHAHGGQGIPIRWSTAEQVQEIATLISNREHAQKSVDRFKGFPVDRVFYKRRSDDRFEGCMFELGQVREFYSRASNAGVAVVSILD